jgi:hypothetical protein
LLRTSHPGLKQFNWYFVLIELFRFSEDPATYELPETSQMMTAAKTAHDVFPAVGPTITGDRKMPTSPPMSC